MTLSAAQATAETYCIKVNGRRLFTDQLGYLLDPSEWDEEVALALAAREEIDLDEDHWHMIRFVREWYEDRQTVPEARWLLKAMKQRLGETKGTRRYLHQLFPHGFGPELCKIAGMTMPRKVMLDV